MGNEQVFKFKPPRESSALLYLFKIMSFLHRTSRPSDTISMEGHILQIKPSKLFKQDTSATTKGFSVT